MGIHHLCPGPSGDPDRPEVVVDEVRDVDLHPSRGGRGAGRGGEEVRPGSVDQGPSGHRAAATWTEGRLPQGDHLPEPRVMTEQPYRPDNALPPVSVHLHPGVYSRRGKR